MSATLLFDEDFTQALPSYPTVFAPGNGLALDFVSRLTGGWMQRHNGVTPTQNVDYTNPNMLLWNPQTASVGSKNQFVELTTTIADSGDQVGLTLRGSISPTQGINVMYLGNGNLHIWRSLTSGGVTGSNMAAAAFVPTIGATYRFFGGDVSIDASTSNVVGWVTADATPNTRISSVSVGEGYAGLQGAGSPGIANFINSVTGNQITGRIRAWTIDGTYSVLGKATSGPTGVTLEAIPIYGTGPFAYQWRSYTTFGGSATNISGATSSTYTYTGGTVGVPMGFDCVVTDTGAGNATATCQMQYGLKTKPAIVLGAIGDSWYGRTIDGYNSGLYTLGTMADLVAKFLARMLNRPVILVNSGLSGATAASWTTANLSTFQTAMAAAKTAAGAGALAYGMIRFGGNEVLTSVSNAQYKTDLSVITSAVTSAGITAVMHDPEFAPSRGAAALDMLVGYKGVVDSMVNGFNILNGDRGQFAYFAANPSAQNDQLHPSVRGNYDVAVREASRLAAIIDPAAMGVSRALVSLL